MSKTFTTTQNKILNLNCMSAWYTESLHLVKKFNKTNIFLSKGRIEEASVKVQIFLESFDASFDEFSILHDASIGWTS